MATISPSYSPAEEIASSVTHGLGIVLSIAGLVALVSIAALEGDRTGVIASVVYGSSLIVLFTASTLYHGIPNAGAKPILRVIDHAAIFLLIAGSYTPYALVTLRGTWGHALLAIVWTLAVLGIALELAGVRRRAVMVTLYLAMGWVGLVAIEPLSERLAPGGLWLLFGGGACYTLGVPFYLWKRLPYNHALWHLFVLAGSVLQFIAVLVYVLPTR
jgi:hemolysin III